MMRDISRQLKEMSGGALLLFSLLGNSEPTHAQTPTVIPQGLGAPVTNLQNSLALSYFMPDFGIFPAREFDGPAEYTMGQVRIQAAARMQSSNSRTLANGQWMSTAQNAALYALVGNRYGGDQNAFRFPDLTGRLAVGTMPDGEWALGESRGSVLMELTEQNLPSHVHRYIDADGLPRYLVNEGQHEPISNLQPSLGLQYMVAAHGASPAGDVPTDTRVLGEVGLFAGDFTPPGWLAADGRLLRIEEHESLFNVIGTIYGGDGQETFALPNLIGRTAIGVGSSNTGSVVSLGEELGQETIYLKANNLPPHLHAVDNPPEEIVYTDVVGQGRPIDNTQPSLGLNYLIATSGVFPNPDVFVPGSNDRYLGEVIAYAGVVVPNGYVPADGRLMGIAHDPALYAILGTTYGGDGVTTFALPDLRGRSIVGAGEGVSPGSQNVAALAAHSALLGEDCGPFFPGDTPGTSWVQLTQNQMPPHTHQVPEPSVPILWLVGAVGLSMRKHRQTS